MIDGGKIPQHVGIIMDGNGRWAQLRGLSRIEGHRQGARRTRDIINEAISIGIKVLSLYAFSIENWKRPREEVSTIMGLLEYYLKEEVEELIREKSIVFRVIGDKKKLPEEIQDMIADLEARTRNNNGMTLVPAISYGSRDEIIRAIKQVMRNGVSETEFNDSVLENFLDTSGLPPVDLVIRTSGEKRISNFLLWQSAYAEFYFTETLWPDFTKDEFLGAVGDFQKRERRFGVIRDGGYI